MIRFYSDIRKTTSKHFFRKTSNRHHTHSQTFNFKALNYKLNKSHTSHKSHIVHSMDKKKYLRHTRLLSVISCGEVIPFTNVYLATANFPANQLHFPNPFQLIYIYATYLTPAHACTKVPKFDWCVVLRTKQTIHLRAAAYRLHSIRFYSSSFIRIAEWMNPKNILYMLSLCDVSYMRTRAYITRRLGARRILAWKMLSNNLIRDFSIYICYSIIYCAISKYKFIYKTKQRLPLNVRDHSKVRGY